MMMEGIRAGAGGGKGDGSFWGGTALSTLVGPWAAMSLLSVCVCCTCLNRRRRHRRRPPPAGPKALLQWLGVVNWFPTLAPPEDPKTAVAGGVGWGGVGWVGWMCVWWAGGRAGGLIEASRSKGASPECHTPAPPPPPPPQPAFLPCTAALYQQLAAKKLSRFREFAAIYPEACFVLVGDNGQASPRPGPARGGGAMDAMRCDARTSSARGISLCLPSCLPACRVPHSALHHPCPLHLPALPPGPPPPLPRSPLPPQPPPPQPPFPLRRATCCALRSCGLRCARGWRRGRAAACCAA